MIEIAATIMMIKAKGRVKKIETDPFDMIIDLRKLFSVRFPKTKAIVNGGNGKSNCLRMYPKKPKISMINTSRTEFATEKAPRIQRIRTPGTKTENGMRVTFANALMKTPPCSNIKRFTISRPPMIA